MYCVTQARCRSYLHLDCEHVNAYSLFVHGWYPSARRWLRRSGGCRSISSPHCKGATERRYKSAISYCILHGGTSQDARPTSAYSKWAVWWWALKHTHARASERTQALVAVDSRSHATAAHVKEERMHLSFKGVCLSVSPSSSCLGAMPWWFLSEEGGFIIS